MSKKILLTVVAFCLVLGLVACGCGNNQLFDTTYTFDRAIISLPDGTIVSGKVESWTDYSDSDQLQITIDGVTYLVHSEDAVMIAE